MGKQKLKIMKAIIIFFKKWFNLATTPLSGDDALIEKW